MIDAIKKEKFIIFLFFVFLRSITNDLFLFRQNQIEHEITNYNKKYENITKLKIYYEKDIPKIKKYILLLKKQYIKSDLYYNKYSKPKISFITTVFNKEKYLYSFICSIQNQYLKEFELIIVDDCSYDRSLEIIKKFKNKDKRIKLIRNKKNMGALYSRYKGAIYSKGKYIISLEKYISIALKYLKNYSLLNNK